MTNTVMTQTQQIIQKQLPIGKMSVSNKQWQQNGIFYGNSPKREILELRSEYTKKFQREDGKVDVIIGGPFHYKDKNNAFQDIDLSITECAEPEYTYKNENNRFISWFAKDKQNGVKLEYKSKFISFGINQLLSAKNWLPSKGASPTIKTSDNTIIYKDFYNDIDIEYELSTEMIMHRLIINKKEVFDGVSAKDFINLSEIIYLPENALLFDSLGLINNNRVQKGFVFVVVNGDTIFTILPPRIWDATFNKEFIELFSDTLPMGVIACDAHISFLENNRINYNLKVPIDWLKSDKRLYPIVVDPSISIGGNGALTYSPGFGNRYPWRTNWWQHLTQAIYLKSEIMMSGNITQIAYRQGVNNGLVNNNATILMQHTNNSLFTADQFITSGWVSALASSSLNYTSGSGTQINCSNEIPIWRTISLTTPFVYDNSQNLMIQTRFQNNSSNMGGGTCNGEPGACCVGGGWYYYNRGSNNILVYGTCDCSNSYPSDPTLSQRAPVIQLTIDPICTPVAILSQPQSHQAFENSNTSFTVSVSGTPPFKYFWFRNGVLVAGPIITNNTTNIYNTPNLTFPGDNGSMYYCNVTNCNDLSGQMSSTALLTVLQNMPCSTPNPPTSLSPTNINSSSFSANWNFVVGATYYLLDVSTTINFTNIIFSNNVGNTNNFNLQGLNPSTQYYYRVYAAQSSCISLPSLTVSVATTGIIASPPIINSINGSSPNNNIKASLGSSVNFTASITSSTPITAWEWTITGGLPYTARNYSVSNPNVTFDILGPYKIKLRVKNSAGLFSTTFVTANNFITVCGSIDVQAKPLIGSKTPNAGVALDPINLATGAYHYNHSDFNIRAVNSFLNFTRYYNTSLDTLNGPLGFGWSHTYNFTAINQDDSLWVVHYGDGNNTYFVPLFEGNGKSFPLHGGTYETLEKDQITGNFKLTFKSGDIYHFNPDGQLSTIVDLNGNVFNFNYNGSNLISIVSPGGRTLNLNYNGNKIQSVVDPLGRVVSFLYDVNDNLIQVTDPNGGLTKFTYDGLHQMTKVVLPKGNTLLTNVYDAQKRVISQSDGLNQITLINYNVPQQDQTTVINPDNSTVIFHHDSLFRKTKIIDELGFQKLYVYDHNNNLTSTQDENGNITSYTYDATGNLLSTTDAENNLTKSTYNSHNRILTQQDPLNNITTYTYDSNQNLVQVNLPNGASKINTYFNGGLQLSASDALGNITTFSYNSLGDLIGINSPSGIKSFSYDGAGRLIAESDENNHTTTYSLNNLDNRIISLDALNHLLKFLYDANGNLIANVDKNGNLTSLEYDFKDRLISKKDAAGGVTTNFYDSRDNLVRIIDANGNSINNGFDQKGRLISRTNSLGTINYTYDPVGNLIIETDPMNSLVSYAFDALNRQIAKTDAVGNQTQYTYDAMDRIVSISDPLGQITKYDFNSIGLLIKITDSNGKFTEMEYDKNGNRISILDANGHAQKFNYDASSRLTKSIDAEGNIFMFSFDGTGNLISEIKPTGTLMRTYDAVNRLTQINLSDGNNYYYTYDFNGNLQTFTNANGTSYFSYDNLNRRIFHKDIFNYEVGFEYDAVGNRISINYPGNLKVKYSYNGNNLMTKVNDWLGNEFIYSYDSRGKLTNLLYPNSFNCKYKYDQACRLISMKNSNLDTIINSSIFTLDGNGQRIEEQRSGPIPFHLKRESFVYKYGNDDRLLSDSISQYTNDNSGNRIMEFNSLYNTIYNFSIDNLLNEILTASTNYHYRYDGLGNRIEKSVNQMKQRYVLDQVGNISQVLQEIDTNGFINANYIYGLGLLARIDSANSISYYHYDAQHNTTALTNENGDITDYYTYQPFGQLLDHIGSINQPFTFLGEYGVQRETNDLYFIRARYYNAIQGRFLSKDPYPQNFKNNQSYNNYIYGLNNPTSIFDITGLSGQKDGEFNLSINERILDEFFTELKYEIIKEWGKDVGDKIIFELTTKWYAEQQLAIYRGSWNIQSLAQQFQYISKFIKYLPVIDVGIGGLSQYYENKYSDLSSLEKAAQISLTVSQRAVSGLVSLVPYVGIPASAAFNVAYDNNRDYVYNQFKKITYTEQIGNAIYNADGFLKNHINFSFFQHY